MATLYVREPGAQVSKADERLRVMRGEEVLNDIPLIKVDRVVLMGRGVSVTTPALFALTQRGIDVVYLTGRGRYVSRMVGAEHKHGKLRHAQALGVADTARALRIAGAIVRGKIANQRALVRRHAEGAGWAKQALAGMEAMARRVETARTLDELRGLEGQGAKEYFGLMRKMLRPPREGGTWGFERRAYYPPPDPVNALLSFGYTLLLNDLIAACQLTGLDPYLGFFHAIDYGRPSMALDLEEEFRPVIVDSIVLTAVNRAMLGLKDFQHAPESEAAEGQGEDSKVQTPKSKFRTPNSKRDREQEGKGAGEQGARERRAIYLTEAARDRFIALYEARVNEQVVYPLTNERNAYRRVFELQAQQMARVVLGEAREYRPVEIR